MRYSYAWRVTPRILLEGFEDWEQHGSRPENPWHDCYVVVRGDTVASRGIVLGLVDVPPLPRVSIWDGQSSDQPDPHDRRFRVILVSNPDTDALAPLHEGTGTISNDTRRGRFIWQPINARVRQGLLDTSASRFHPTSVAGLVVAAFGTFVFALYLRRWMKERGKKTKAAT